MIIPINNKSKSLSWNVSDLQPNVYVIYINGSVIASGTWNSETPINLALGRMSFGAYNYTIVVSDSAGNSASDTVWVSVVLPNSKTVPSSSHPQGSTHVEGNNGRGNIYIPGPESIPVVLGSVGGFGYLFRRRGRRGHH